MFATLGAVERGSYTFLGGAVIALPPRARAFFAIKYDVPPAAPPRVARAPLASTRVAVIERDCLLAGRDVLQRGLRPAVLNLASSTDAGGGYESGAGAQEENITRRSDYAWSVHRARDVRAPHYPLRGGVYSPAITVFRASEDEGYAFLPEPYTLAIVGVAAERKPRLSEDRSELRDDDSVLRLYRALQTTLAIALAHGHDAIILGALGCGAYCNPPSHVAEICAYALAEYGGLFREITFAIIDDHNARKAHNPLGNFQPFYDALHGRPLAPHGAATIPFAARAGRNLCRYGGSCDGSHGPSSDIDDVPRCAAAAMSVCDDASRTHRLLLRHRDCPRGARCPLWHDAAHAALFRHPDPCRCGGIRNDISSVRAFSMWWSTTSDFAHWSAPQPLYTPPRTPGTQFYLYLALLYADASGPARGDHNYAAIGQTATLTYVSVTNNFYTEGRQIFGVKISFIHTYFFLISSACVLRMHAAGGVVCGRGCE